MQARFGGRDEQDGPHREVPAYDIPRTLASPPPPTTTPAVSLKGDSQQVRATRKAEVQNHPPSTWKNQIYPNRKNPNSQGFCLRSTSSPMSPQLCGAGSKCGRWCQSWALIPGSQLEEHLPCTSRLQRAFLDNLISSPMQPWEEVKEEGREGGL